MIGSPNHEKHIARCSKIPRFELPFLVCRRGRENHKMSIASCFALTNCSKYYIVMWNNSRLKHLEAFCNLIDKLYTCQWEMPLLRVEASAKQNIPKPQHARCYLLGTLTRVHGEDLAAVLRRGPPQKVDFPFRNSYLRAGKIDIYKNIVKWICTWWVGLRLVAPFVVAMTAMTS